MTGTRGTAAKVLLSDAALANKDLAEIAARIGRSHPKQTGERRAASALYAALVTTGSPAAARRALATFADTVTRTAALKLLDDIELARTPIRSTIGETHGRRT